MISIKNLSKYSSDLFDGNLDLSGVDLASSRGAYAAQVAVELENLYGLESGGVAVRFYYAGSKYGTVQHGYDTSHDLSDSDHSPEPTTGITYDALQWAEEKVWNRGEFYITEKAA